METEPKIELATLKVQLKNIQDTINEVKVAVTDIVQISKSVAMMEVRQQAHDDKIDEIQKRVEALEVRQSTNTAYLNKLRGGVSLSVTLMTLVQAAVLAGASWLLTSVIDAREEVSILKQHVQYVEAEHDRVIRALIQGKHVTEQKVEGQ